MQSRLNCVSEQIAWSPARRRQTTSETRKRLPQKGRTVSTDRFFRAFSSLVFNFASRLHFGLLETNRLIPPPHLRFTYTTPLPATWPDSLLFCFSLSFSLPLSPVAFYNGSRRATETFVVFFLDVVQKFKKKKKLPRKKKRKGRIPVIPHWFTRA